MKTKEEIIFFLDQIKKNGLYYYKPLNENVYLESYKFQYPNFFRGNIEFVFKTESGERREDFHHVNEAEKFIDYFTLATMQETVKSEIIKTNDVSGIIDLRKILTQTLEDFRSGKIDANKAKTISNVSQTIMNTITTEIKLIQFINSKK